MTPNELLQSIRETRAALHSAEVGQNLRYQAKVADQLDKLFGQLDARLSGGGSLPDDWRGPCETCGESMSDHEPRTPDACTRFDARR